MTRQINVETLHPQTRMLSDEQIQAIHHSTLDILSQTGIVMKNKRAPSQVKEDVILLKKEFNKVKFGFQSAEEALKYIQRS